VFSRPTPHDLPLLALNLPIHVFMFRFLGSMVARFWPLVIGAWVLLLGLSWWWAPEWDTVARSGEVAFLPDDSPSRRSEQLFREAFPDQYAASSIVLVIERQGAALQDADKQFINQVLAPRIRQGTTETADKGTLVARIHTPADEATEVLLVSPDRQASLAVIELTTSFIDPRNNPVVAAVEKAVGRLRDEKAIPAGLAIEVTGIATAGRDLLQAEKKSIRAIEQWTFIIVSVLLLVIYRAPLVALIPLATVFVAVQTALNCLALLASAGILDLDRDARIFITVLAYGAGVDYCVFLSARFREELESGATAGEATVAALAHVGGAITASAATVICGIATLAFARFGRIHQAGLTIPFALFLVLCAALTFSAALLRVCGRAAFWPQPVATPAEPARARPGLLRRLAAQHVLPSVWDKLAAALLARPSLIWFASVAVLAPFVVIALLHYRDQIYNPLSELPADTPSTLASRGLEQHFPSGTTAPLLILLKSAWVDFSEEKNREAIARLAHRLLARKDQLGIADLRSVNAPLGSGPPVEQVLGFVPVSIKNFPQSARQRAIDHYVSHAGQWVDHVTHMDVVLTADPFSRRALGNLDEIEAALRIDVPESALAFAGATASARDLAVIKQSDQRLAEILVPAVVLVLLLLILRRLVISVYLVLSVLFSYAATLGITLVVFGLTHWGGYEAMDWKVPIFLFTILVAVGEDYNIFLMTRIQEEVGRHGPLEGIREALKRTGKVITTCGLIMAGTFATLLSGSLLAMKELGFALALGILLDTLVVRPILVPAFLILLQNGRLGVVGKRQALARDMARQARAA
jgi:RND superfamily putative drug exporter